MVESSVVWKGRPIPKFCREVFIGGEINAGREVPVRRDVCLKPSRIGKVTIRCFADNDQVLSPNRFLVIRAL